MIRKIAFGRIRMGLADLHIHSIHSFDGTSSIPAILKYTVDNTNLDVIAITDYDSMKGVSQAIDLAPSNGSQIIQGCEISSTEGHVPGLFLNRCVPAGLSFLQTLQLIGEQGGLAPGMITLPGRYTRINRLQPRPSNHTGRLLHQMISI